jgi:tetratricopeptide (TPR) repeat protein
MVIITVGVTLWRGWRVEAPPEPIAQTPPPITTPRSGENPWRDLEIAKAEYAPATPTDDLIWRDEGSELPSAPKVSLFARAMRPYQQDDFAEAERRLEQFLEKNPKHAEAHFYRGVSLLLLGRTADAVAPLETAVEHGDAQVREEAQWYLAQAYLKLGEPSKALPHLDAVIERSEKHRSEALPLRQQVREALRQ